MTTLYSYHALNAMFVTKKPHKSQLVVFLQKGVAFPHSVAIVASVKNNLTLINS